MDLKILLASKIGLKVALDMFNSSGKEGKVKIVIFTIDSLSF